MTGYRWRPAAQVQLARELYAQGRSLGELANIFGVHKSTISRWVRGLRRADVPDRGAKT